MFSDIKSHVKDWKNDDEIYAYLEKIVNKEAFDQSGLIYGMGHAVYTLSDPRAVILKEYARSLSEEKGLTEEFMLYSKVEQLASELVTGRKNLHKRNLLQCRLLQRICVFDARHSDADVYSDLCDFPYRRLVGTPD